MTEPKQAIDLLMSTFGPNLDQLHGYGGHPELELAMLRLYSATKDPRHLQFGGYLLEERGQKRADQGDETYFCVGSEGEAERPRSRPPDERLG